MYRQLRGIYPSLACRQFLDSLQQLERECGYGEDGIPQLGDVSAFLRGDSSPSHSASMHAPANHGNQQQTPLIVNFKDNFEQTTWAHKGFSSDRGVFSSFQRRLVSSSARSPACCRPETFSTVWLSGCFSARSTSVTPLLRCTLPNRELCLWSSSAPGRASLTPSAACHAGTAAMSCWDTFPCWQTRSLPSSRR